MKRFIAKRLIASIIILWLATVLVFGLSRAAGDPTFLFISEYTTDEVIAEWRIEFGLDKPLPVQYFNWLSKAVLGDFGASLNEVRPAADVVKQRLPATLELAAVSFLFALAIGIPVGVLSAVKRGTMWDLSGRMFALVGQATPNFWMGIILVLIFSVQFKLLPTSGRGGLDHLILPAITLGSGSAAGLARLTRSAMLEMLDSEFIKFARAKGVSGQSVVWKHAFRNALIVPITYAGLMLAAFTTGTVIVETVFGWPGLGRLAVTAINDNDFPVMSATVLLFTVMYIGVNLVVDISYALVDPRIRQV
jgi:peptide/nickel transport system permease protein